MLPKSVQRLIDEFSRLPGIGPKSAARLVFFLLTKHPEDISSLGSAVMDLKKSLRPCSICYNICEEDVCEICENSERDKALLCVVEEPLDVVAIERTGYEGLYHVLGGAISPINGVGPDDLRIRELVERVRTSDTIREVILATNPSLEGEATAIYISDRLGDLPVKVTRLARGLPIGGDLEYADELTLSRSLEGRKEI